MSLNLGFSGQKKQACRIRISTAKREFEPEQTCLDLNEFAWRCFHNLNVPKQSQAVK